MIYLDNNATTRPSSRVIGAMQPYLSKCYFNASASTASFTGADRPRRDAAMAMAKLLRAEESDCFTFTSGATESNNWVLYSLAKTPRAGRVLISAIEHASVSEPTAELRRVGFEVLEIPVDAYGVVRLDALRDALTDDTALVSIMAANNETGVLQPIEQIGRLIRESCPAALFHTDASQAVGKITVNLQSDWQEVDLLSFSAHKFHGPKGVGGLYIRPGVLLEPMLLGGAQEHGLRSGTVNTPGLAGLAASAVQAAERTEPGIRHLRDLFEDELFRSHPDVVIHSQDAPRLPNTSCFSIPGLVGEDLVQWMANRGIIIGTGAACSSGSIDPSKTLRAMSVSHDVSRSAVRVSLSALSVEKEIALLLDELGAYRTALHSRFDAVC